MHHYILILALLFMAGCSSDDTTDEQQPLVSDFDADALPVESGNWYKPVSNSSWQWQLTGTLNTGYDVDIYDIDLFDTEASTISSLQAQGKKVICYFSGGSYEEWRDDAASFPDDVLGSALDGWAGERWLDISNGALMPIMRARLDLAVQKGCDGVEPDNMDGYTNDSGFALSAGNQLAYNKFIANEARSRGLAVVLKNDLDQVATLEPYFDISINEQCHEYSECDLLLPFIQNDKPVLIAEYDSSYKSPDTSVRDLMCSDSNAQGFKTLILALDLDDSYRDSCF